MISAICQGKCGRRGHFDSGFCENCIQSFCKRCGKKISSAEEPQMRMFCSSCSELKMSVKKNVDGSEHRVEPLQIFDPVILKLRRQLRQLEEEKTELVSSKRRIAVTPQLALIDQKMQDIRKKLKTRQTGMSV